MSRIVRAFFTSVVALCSLCLAQGPAPWRYDLRPGDRLVYSYTFRREVRGDRAESVVEARYRTQVLIAGVREGMISAGFQRNRESAELLTYRAGGKDKLSSERPNFEKRMQARPSQFSEAMEFNAAGEPRYSWEVSRETSSHLLPALHEIELLPAQAAKPGDRWYAMDLLGLQFEWVGSETVRGKICYHVKGTGSDGSITLSYWWSPESGVIERIDLEGTYGVPAGTSHEHAQLELESRTRDETLGSWLSKSETRLGALEALLLSPSVSMSVDELSAGIDGNALSAQRLALAVAARRHLQLPASVVNTLRGSPDPEIKSLASEVIGPRTAAGPTSDCVRVIPKKSEAPKFGTLFRVALPEKEGERIPYFLRIPLTYRGDHPLPLLIYLSGGAGFGLDGVNTASDALVGTNYLVLYPQAGEFWWKPEVAARLDAALRDTFKEFNVDRDRVYLAGFSNGGTGALYMAELWPQRFAAVVSLMGAGQCNEDVQKMLPNLANVPLLFVHGDKDPIIAPDCSKVTDEAIGALRPRAAPQLRILPDREHDITLTSDDGLTLPFLKDKARDPFPKRIAARIPDLTFPRQYWVEVLEKKGGEAELNAEIKRDNAVEIRSRDVKRLRIYLRPEMFPQAGPVRVRWNGKQVFEGALRDVCAAAGADTTGDPKLDFADGKELAVP